ncbi:hypothetical protein XH93_12170 [Bradyrhizobium sp. CCBAU 51753]|nr:hypothetical protein XH93_12170 [Bradyrhizobium sp. CCBAU 51753]
MQIEDGLIWVCGVVEDGVQAFTDFGIESLIELVRLQEKPQAAHALATEMIQRACGLRRMPTQQGDYPPRPNRRLAKGSAYSMRRRPTRGNDERHCSEAEKPRSTWSIWSSLNVFATMSQLSVSAC